MCKELDNIGYYYQYRLVYVRVYLQIESIPPLNFSYM